MNDAIAAFLIGFPALFSIVNPISGALIFQSVTALKGLVGNPARLKTDKGRGKVVCPAPEGLIRTLRPGGPFHEHPELAASARGYRQEMISLALCGVKLS